MHITRHGFSCGCDAVGSMGCISFVLTTKYNWSEEQLGKVIRIAHYFIWPISVFRAGILLFFDLYNPSVMGIYCAVAMAPLDCTESGEPCQRGSERHMVINTYISTFCFVVVIDPTARFAVQATEYDYFAHTTSGTSRCATPFLTHCRHAAGENGSSSGAVGSSRKYEDVGTGDDSTSARGSSRSVLNHGRQQRRNVLRQTSSTIRRRDHTHKETSGWILALYMRPMAPRLSRTTRIRPQHPTSFGSSASARTTEPTLLSFPALMLLEIVLNTTNEVAQCKYDETELSGTQFALCTCDERPETCSIFGKEL